MFDCGTIKRGAHRAAGIKHTHARADLGCSLGDGDTADEIVVHILDRLDRHQWLCGLVGDRQGVEHRRALLGIKPGIDERSVGADNFSDARRERIRETVVIECIVSHG